MVGIPGVSRLNHDDVEAGCLEFGDGDVWSAYQVSAGLYRLELSIFCRGR
jgi:hypothetical protein